MSLDSFPCLKPYECISLKSGKSAVSFLNYTSSSFHFHVHTFTPLLFLCKIVGERTGLAIYKRFLCPVCVCVSWKWQTSQTLHQGERLSVWFCMVMPSGVSSAVHTLIVWENQRHNSENVGGWRRMLAWEGAGRTLKLENTCDYMVITDKKKHLMHLLTRESLISSTELFPLSWFPTVHSHWDFTGQHQFLYCGNEDSIPLSRPLLYCTCKCSVHIFKIVF